MKRAATLDDAYDALDPQPLEFPAQAELYVEPPPRMHDDESDSPSPLQRIRDDLGGPRPNKVFLAGHVGAGKSTQLRHLAADPELRKMFSVVEVRLDPADLPKLDVAQLLYHMAHALYDHGKARGALGDSGKLKKSLEALGAALHASQDSFVAWGPSEIEVDAGFLKMRQELQFNGAARRSLRKLSEKPGSALHDLLQGLSTTIQTELFKKGLPSALLLLIDDLDKVRDKEQQEDIFHENWSVLQVPDVRVVYTVPAGVSLDAGQGDLMRRMEHLYPERVLDKARGLFDPMKALLPDSSRFLTSVLHRRVEPGLFTEDAITTAIAFSGGVMRDYLRLLKEACAIARYKQFAKADTTCVRAAIGEERRRWTRTLSGQDYQVLLQVHRTHQREHDETHRRLLDLGLMLECYNDDTWYEAHPLLWSSLERHDKASSQ